MEVELVIDTIASNSVTPASLEQWRSLGATARFLHYNVSKRSAPHFGSQLQPPCALARTICILHNNERLGCAGLLLNWRCSNCMPVSTYDASRFAPLHLMNTSLRTRSGADAVVERVNSALYPGFAHGQLIHSIVWTIVHWRLRWTGRTENQLGSILFWSSVCHQNHCAKSCGSPIFSIFSENKLVG